MSVRIGIDLGGTKIEAAALATDGRILLRRRIPTPREDYDAICSAIGSLVRQVERDLEVRASVGVGMPGIISPVTGLVKNANTVCLIGMPFGDDLQARLERPVRIDNDANCLLLSEVNGGAASGAESAFGVILGTGTGGALYANGGLIRGANAIAGEWGHNAVPWAVSSAAERHCYCGKRNCVETFLCGSGLVRTFAELGGRAAPDVETILRFAPGDPPARAALEAYLHHLTACLAHVINLFDPAVIVLGGGLSNLPNLCSDIASGLPALVFSDSIVTRVSTARFGDSSGVLGAANLWAAA